MALQTISQILSPTNAPYINGVAARLKFSQAVLKNLYQGLVEKDGKGVDDNYVKADEAEQNAQIFVHRILPIEVDPREMGASRNGGAYSQNQHFSRTETVGIEVLQVIDDPILLPRFTQDKIGVDLLAKEIQNFVDRLATILNGATTASKILATYLAKANGEQVNETVIDDTVIAANTILDQFVIANGLLDEGDEAHGLDIFPRKTRVAVVKMSFGPILKTKGVFKLGGANEVYEILKAAGATNTGERIEDDGYIGNIDGVEVRVISNESLKHASKFLGFPAYELKNAPIWGYIASSYANARGVSTREQTKVVDEVNGQGVRLLPYVNFGCACWYQKGNSFLVKEEYNPFGGLKTLLSSAAATTTFKVKSAGSRLFPVFGATGISFTDTTHASLTAVALDDWNNDHIKGSYYYVGSAAATTVHAFLKAYDGASVKGSANLNPTTGGTITLASAIEANQYLNVLSVADDGSVSLISKKYA